MKPLHCIAIAVITLMPAAASAQDDASADRLMARVRSALAPVLSTFPTTDSTGSVPADGKPTALWIVPAPQPGERTIEILANPLNEDYQRRAAKAMAEIESSIEAAQRRADVQYERAIAEAKRSRQSQDVVGITLVDEGVAGARIDAESHVTIEVWFNQPSYRFEIASSLDPIVDNGVVSIRSNVYRDPKTGEERFCEGQTLIYLGRSVSPSISEAARIYTVTATAPPPSNPGAISSIVVRLRGNEDLMGDLLRKGDWRSLLELLE